MTDLTPSSAPGLSEEEPLLDALLREAVPEIKLALGDLIDRDNQRAIPDRYARMLPQTVLVVTLRPDAADAVQPIAAELEGELTDSCMRHGSLYDREYRVRLRQAGQQGAPLFRVSVGKPGEPEPVAIPEPAPAPQPAPAPHVTAMSSPAPGASPLSGETVAVFSPPPPPLRPPAEDPDATRLDGVAAPAPARRWDTDRFHLVVEEENGTERESFPIPAPMTTVGRRPEQGEPQSDLLLTDAKHVSRRQLALVFAPRGDEAGFTVYNLGLNAVHVGEREIAGANVKGGPLQLGELMETHTARLLPGDAVRIGQHGPVLRIRDTTGGGDGGTGNEEVDAGPPVDPDATQFG